MTTVIESFPAPYEKWQPLFVDFARVNYFKDYDFATTLFADVQVPREVHRPVANPSIPLDDDLLIEFAPAAVYHEIHPAALNIARGADATGATLHLTLDPACGSCGLDGLTLDTFFYRNGALLTHTATILDYTFAQTLTSEFASASGVTSMTLIVANAPPRTLSTQADLWLTATDNPPLAPATLTATAYFAGISLAWSPVHEEGIRYVIEREDWQGTSILATVSTPTHGYTDASAHPGTVYRYRVRALDTGGNLGPASPFAQALVCPLPQPLLVVYLFDASDSMRQLYAGSTTKLAAAKEAILAGNDLLRTWNTGSRAGLVVVQASPNLGPPHYRSLIFPNTYHTAPTTNLAALETELGRVTWYGNSPLAHALRWAGITLRNAAASTDSTQRPVVVWLTDGQPTVSYEDDLGDWWGYPFLSEDVQDVPLRERDGSYRPLDAIRDSGWYYPRYDLHAGEPPADAMEAAFWRGVAHTPPTVHAIEVQFPAASTFEWGLLPYVATIRGGLAAAPATPAALHLSVLQALAQSACLPATPTP